MKSFGLCFVLLAVQADGVAGTSRRSQRTPSGRRLRRQRFEDKENAPPPSKFPLFGQKVGVDFPAKKSGGSLLDLQVIQEKEEKEEEKEEGIFHECADSRELLLVLANPESGNQTGKRILEIINDATFQKRFAEEFAKKHTTGPNKKAIVLQGYPLHPGAQGANEAPADQVAKFMRLHNVQKTELVRVVVGGGDGTVSFVLPVLRESGMNFAIATLPLGTGNDFSRTIGHGGGMEWIITWGALISRLGNVLLSKTDTIDQWNFELELSGKQDFEIKGAKTTDVKIPIVESAGEKSPELLLSSTLSPELVSSKPLKITGTFQNYLTWGMDAAVAGDVDDFRNTPWGKKMAKGIGLKPVYGVKTPMRYGKMRFLSRELSAVGEGVTISSTNGGDRFEPLALTDTESAQEALSAGWFNIPQYAGGMDVFKKGKTAIPHDGLLEFGTHGGNPLKTGVTMLTPPRLNLTWFERQAKNANYQVHFSQQMIDEWVACCGGLPLQHDGEHDA